MTCIEGLRVSCSSGTAFKFYFTCVLACPKTLESSEWKFTDCAVASEIIMQPQLVLS